VKAVSISLDVLGLAVGIQVAIYVLSGSVALLRRPHSQLRGCADRAATRDRVLLPFSASRRFGGYFVVLAIFLSACVALVETILRLIHPQQL
jgi:divalent metal cation (Fe/Co/Zn/Cd) transporter